MLSNTFAYFRATIFLVLLIHLVGESTGKPRAQSMNPLDQPTFLETTRTSCTSDEIHKLNHMVNHMPIPSMMIENLCQRCAKKTKSPVVYPWCCTDHEGTREWCDNYLHYGRD